MSPAAPRTLLAADRLRVTVPAAGRAAPRVLIESLDLQVQPGEFWCLLGPNGVGKTQLLHTLAGARAPASGVLSLAGRPLQAWPLRERACLRGYLPQQWHDAFAAPVLDVVLQGRHPHLSRWHWEGEADHALALDALARVGLADLAARDVRSLSGGERQRVALAGLLTQDPPLALLDEPLAHLDLSHQLKVLALLQHEVRDRGRAVLMSVHDLSLAQRVATHVLLLGGPRGQAWAGPADEVMQPARLSAVFGQALSPVQALGQTWWLPADPVAATDD